jgi:hypothetical protein
MAMISLALNQHIREPAVAIASRRRGAFAAVRPIEVAQQFGSRNTSRDREDGQIAGAGLDQHNHISPP